MDKIGRVKANTSRVVVHETNELDSWLGPPHCRAITRQKTTMSTIINPSTKFHFFKI